jgi:hypothetical protein
MSTTYTERERTVAVIIGTCAVPPTNHDIQASLAFDWGADTMLKNVSKTTASLVHKGLAKRILSVEGWTFILTPEGEQVANAFMGVSK